MKSRRPPKAGDNKAGRLDFRNQQIEPDKGKMWRAPLISEVSKIRVAADVWEKDVWEFQAKSGSSGSCRLLLHFPGKIGVEEMSGRTPGSPRHPSSRHPRSSEKRGWREGIGDERVPKHSEN